MILAFAKKVQKKCSDDQRVVRVSIRLFLINILAILFDVTPGNKSIFFEYLLF